MCQDEEQCKFFTWTKRTCHMKTAIQYVCKKTEDTVSLDKDCLMKEKDAKVDCSVENLTCTASAKVQDFEFRAAFSLFVVNRALIVLAQQQLLLKMKHALTPF
jgi:hypothetical protein